MDNNRLGQSSPAVVKFIKETLRSQKKLDVLIAEAVEVQKTSSRKVDIMESVKGMGPVAIVRHLRVMHVSRGPTALIRRFGACSG